jgi:hypothetical protein
VLVLKRRFKRGELVQSGLLKKNNGSAFAWSAFPNLSAILSVRFCDLVMFGGGMAF